MSNDVLKCARAARVRSCPRPLFSLLVAAVFLGSLVGCGGRRNQPTNAAAAKEALATTLDAWKSGGKPEDLKGRDPSIVVRDSDWSAGKRLVSYQVANETDDGFRLHCTVDLVVASDQGETKMQADYVVGTDPVITVMRQE